MSIRWHLGGGEAGDRFVIRRYRGPDREEVIPSSRGKAKRGYENRAAEQLASPGLLPASGEWTRMAGLKGLSSSEIVARTDFFPTIASLQGYDLAGLVK